MYRNIYHIHNYIYLYISYTCRASPGDVQEVSAAWVSFGSYSQWVIPIQARSSQVELRLGHSNFSAAPESDAGKLMELSGWQVHLRHTWTTTSTTITFTSTSFTSSRPLKSLL